MIISCIFNINGKKRTLAYFLDLMKALKSEPFSRRQSSINPQVRFAEDFASAALDFNNNDKPVNNDVILLSLILSLFFEPSCSCFIEGSKENKKKRERKKRSFKKKKELCL